MDYIHIIVCAYILFNKFKLNIACPYFWDKLVPMISSYNNNKHQNYHHIASLGFARVIYYICIQQCIFSMWLCERLLVVVYGRHEWRRHVRALCKNAGTAYFICWPGGVCVCLCGRACERIFGLCRQFPPRDFTLWPRVVMVLAGPILTQYYT